MKKQNATAKSDFIAKRFPVNKYTGKPRRWTYGAHNTGTVNVLLEMAEAQAHFGNKGWDVWPLDVLKKMYDELQFIAGNKLTPTLIELGCDPTGAHGMLLQIEQRESRILTDAELRYCELEGIKPEDFKR